jgi:hypothetical protein
MASVKKILILACSIKTVRLLLNSWQSVPLLLAASPVPSVLRTFAVFRYGLLVFPSHVQFWPPHNAIYQLLSPALGTYHHVFYKHAFPALQVLHTAFWCVLTLLDTDGNEYRHLLWSRTLRGVLDYSWRTFTFRRIFHRTSPTAALKSPICTEARKAEKPKKFSTLH